MKPLSSEKPKDNNLNEYDGFTKLESFNIKSQELFIGMNEDTAQYMVCCLSWDHPKDYYFPFDMAVHDDYLAAVSDYCSRLSSLVKSLELERQRRWIRDRPFSIEDCEPDCHKYNLKNRVVVLNVKALAPEYRSPDYQLMLVIDGYGCHPGTDAHGFYGHDLYTGEVQYSNRKDVLGVLKPERMPDWAKKKLYELQPERQPKKERKEGRER